MDDKESSVNKQCIAPHEIQEGDLVAFLEGVASSKVNEHIARCSACAKEVESLRRVDALFKTVLGRSNKQGE